MPEPLDYKNDTNYQLKKEKNQLNIVKKNYNILTLILVFIISFIALIIINRHFHR